MDNIKLKIIIGSTRQGRFGDKPAQWIYELAKQKAGVDVELLDLRDYQMPFFDEPKSPSAITEPYANPVVQKWTAKIADGDAFIAVTPEYNHSYPAVLKNAMDYVGKEWHDKAIGFVSYGSAAGARAIEHLRGVAIELQMAPIRSSVHIPTPWLLFKDGALPPGALDSFNPNANALLDQLIWWAQALKTARAK